MSIKPTAEMESAMYRALNAAEPGRHHAAVRAGLTAVLTLIGQDLQAPLSSINNALRNGSHMNNANLAFAVLCDRLGIDEEALPPFDPYWTSALSCWHGKSCFGSGPDCEPAPVTPKGEPS